MKNFCGALLCSILFSFAAESQVIDSKYFAENREVYFSFSINSFKELENLNRLISIDNISDKLIYAYADEKGYQAVVSSGYKINILPHPGDVESAAMSSTLEGIREWDVYPTYDAYVQMMQQFAETHSNLCRLVDAGTTVQGRKILFAVISDNVNVREAEPQFMYSSTMHGDETTGYVLMLRLIDYLLTNYNTDPSVAALVNNLEIWINPNANPDGTYRNGNSTVVGARRYNANSVDLNRNFPDPAAGPHPDGKTWQPETIAMMNIAQQNNFSLSGNFHGGAEVVNYPWDTWSRTHPDNNWFRSISRRYADTVHANAVPGYLTYLDNGITNGYAWYRVTGGRQDYYTYFRRGREITFEISNTKLLTASQLPAHWNYNKRSLLQYMENALYGIKGVITDTAGNPVKALVKVNSYDFDQSEIYSDSLTGSYLRMLSPGTYSITVTADSFYSQTINNITVFNFSAVNLNIELVPDHPVPVELTSFYSEVSGADVILYWSTATETNNKGFEVEKSTTGSTWNIIGFVPGKGTSTDKAVYSFADKNASGKAMYRLKQIDFNGTYEYSKILETSVQPLKFALEQNYPNPFNPSTNIRYAVAEEGIVKISVYDMLGNEIAVLVNENKKPGVYEVEFAAATYTSGIYFCKITACGFTKTNKMLLLK